jgi:hypothetical protein
VSKLSSIAATVLAAFALAGCSGAKPGEYEAEQASSDPCYAASLEEGPQAQQEKIQAECTKQKNVEADERENKAAVEALREGERLRER